MTHPLSSAYVASCFDRGDKAQTAQEKGDALEDAVAHVLGSVPGLRVVARDRTNTSGSEEIDLGVLNEQHPDGLGTLFEPWFFVECRNLSGPVDSKALRDFAGKVRARARSFGVLVSAAGITGDRGELRHANDVVRGELQDGREIVVVTREDLTALNTPADFVDLLLRRRSNLIMSQTTADEPWWVADAPESSAATARETKIESIDIRVALRQERERLATEMLTRAPALPEDDALAAQKLTDHVDRFRSLIEAARGEQTYEKWREVLSGLIDLGATAVAMLARVSGEPWGPDAVAFNSLMAAPNVRDALPGSGLFDQLLLYYSAEVAGGADMRRESAGFGLVGLLIESYWRLDDGITESRYDHQERPS